jgi:hypothetical protein
MLTRVPVDSQDGRFGKSLHCGVMMQIRSADVIGRKGQVVEERQSGGSNLRRVDTQGESVLPTAESRDLISSHCHRGNKEEEEKDRRTRIERGKGVRHP